MQERFNTIILNFYSKYNIFFDNIDNNDQSTQIIKELQKTIQVWKVIESIIERYRVSRNRRFL